MNDTLVPKKKRTNIISEVEAEAEAPSSGGLEGAGGAIADQLQGLFGNKVVEAALGGGGEESSGILSFASVLRDATKLNNMGIGNAGPMGTMSASSAMDLGSKAREAAQGALQNGVEQLTGGLQESFGLGGGGGGGDFLSGFAMRSAKGSGGFSQGDVASSIKGSSGQSLPSSLSTKLSLIMGMDMSKVRIHTDTAAAQASEAMSAHAFALGSDVFFNAGQFRPGTPEGDAVIIEELTHVMQFDKGMLPTAPQGSGITTSDPTDQAEVQAKGVASQLAGMMQLPIEELEQQAGQIAPMMTQASGLLDGSAMRFWNPFSSGSSGGGAGAAAAGGGATSIRLQFNSLSISAPLPPGAEAGQTVQVTIPNTVEGVKFGSCSVTLDQAKQPASGTVSVTVQVKEYVGPKQASLTIQAGGQVDAKINDCPLKLGNLATGKMNCRITNKGVEGAAVLKGNQFNLTHNFKSDGGQIAVELENQEIKGEGTISGELSGIGKMTLNGKVANEELTGLADVTVNKGLKVVSGVTISHEGESKISGTYEHSKGCQAEGQIVTDVKDFMRGTVKGSMDTAEKQWNATGLAEQTKNYEVGNVTLANGMLQVEVENGSAGPMEGAFDFTYQEFKGTLEGTYDPATNIAEGSIEVGLKSPKQLGQAGVLETCRAKGTMTNSTFETVTGEFSAKLNLRGEKTFEASLEDGTYTASSNEVSGTASLELLRDLKVPEGTNAHVTIKEGATAEATVAANKIESVSTKIEWQADDGAGQFAEGSVQADFKNDAVSGKGDLTLTDDYGLPERSNEYKFVHDGSRVDATATNDKLETVQLTKLGFTVENEESGGFMGMGSGGRFKGQVDGTFELPEPKVDATVQASVESAWAVNVPYGSLSLEEGGTATGTVANNELKTLEVDVPFESTIEGKPQIELEGNVKGTLDVPAKQFSGEAKGTLASDVPITLGNGATLKILTGGSIQASIQKNNVETVKLEQVQVQYHDQGQLASGSFDGTIKTQGALVSGTGNITLDRDLKIGVPGGGERLEDWQALLKKGGSLDVTLLDNKPQIVQIDLEGGFEKKGKEVAKGKVQGSLKLGEEETSYNGSAQADLIAETKWKEASPFSYSLGENTSVKAQLQSSKVQSAYGSFEVLAQIGGTNKAKATVQTQYQAGSGISGFGDVEILDDIEIWSGGENKLFAVAGESKATATIQNDEFKKVEGTLTLRFDEGGSPLLKGAFAASWTPQVKTSLNGRATVETLRDYQMGEGSPTGLQFWLDSGASVEALFQQSNLWTLKGKAGVTVKKGEPFAKGELDGTYDHRKPTYDGKGSVEITKDTDLGAVYPGGKALLKKGGGAQGEIAQGELKKLSVKVPLRIDDDEAGQNFATMDLQGDYDHPSKVFSGTASAEIHKKKELGKAGEFTVHVLPTSGVDVTVDSNEITKASGKINAQADTDGSPFAKAELQGTWTKTDGMSGNGNAEILAEEYEVTTLGSFTVFVMKGTGAKVTMASNEVTKVSGQVNVEVRKGGAQFLKGKVTGEADLQTKKVKGEGTVNVVKETELGRSASAIFSVLSGSVTVNGPFEKITVDQLKFAAENTQGTGLFGASSGGRIEGTVDGTFAPPESQVDGTVEATLTKEWGVQVSFGALGLQPGGSIKGSVQANELQDVSIDLPYEAQIDGTPQVDFKGNISGTWTVPSSDVTGKATGTLTRDVPMDLGNGARVVVKSGSGIEVDVQSSKADKVALKSVNVDYFDEGLLASGTFDGDITTSTNKISGTGKVTLKRDVALGVPGAGERMEDWQAVLLTGGSLEVVVKDNMPQEGTVKVSGRLDKGGEPVAIGGVDGTLKLGEEETGFTGTAGAKLSTEVKWKEGKVFDYALGTETQADAQLNQSKIESAKGTFSMLAKDGGTNKAKANLDTTYVAGQGISGKADITILDDIEIWSGGNDKLMAIAGESSATATFTEDELTHVKGAVTLRYDEEGSALLKGSFDVDWTPTEQASLSGRATVETLRDYQLGENSASGLQFWLDSGTSIEATMEKSTLKILKGNAAITVKKGDAFATGKLEGTYDHEKPQFDGKGSVEVTKDQDLGAAYPGGKALLMKGTGATGEVAETELKTLSVKVPLRIDDDEAGEKFASMGLEGTYDHPETLFDGKASAEVHKEKKVGSKAGFDVFLLPNSGVAATVAKNELTEVSATVKMRADEKGEGFAEATLEGNWTKSDGMTGSGEAKLLVEEYEIANLGTFKVYVMQGTGAKMEVEQNEVARLSGEVPFQVRKGSDPFMEGKLSGSADLKNDKVDGNATVKIVKEQQLAEFNETTFWVTAGTGISVDFANNKVTKIGGNLNLSLRQPDEFIKINLTDGQLDLESDKPEFSGKGKATGTKEQIIFDQGDYKFALTKDTSAEAQLTKNQITTIKGTVGFRVYNKEGPLVKGSVEGNYDGTTGKVSGTGQAELEQLQKYGPNEEIHVLPGTKGEATVTDSKVDKVKGTIKAELHDDEGALVRMEAEGEFDAVKPEIVKLEGTATLLRDIEPIPGVVISDVSGTGKVEKNKIVEVSGTGKVTVAAIGLTGEFEANWAVEGGEDKYWGKAKAGLKMDKPLEGHSKRGVTGAGIEAELTKSGDFNVKAEVEYALTDKIGGSIGIEQKGPEIDPILSGTINAEGTLIDSRDLFSWEKELVSGTVMAGPIPIAYGVKGAMGAKMKPLKYTADLGISNFHIMELNVPDFEAEMGLTGGANFYAKIMPYVGVGVSFGGGKFKALGGLEGQAGVDVDVDLGMKGKLIGKSDKYSGELGIGATVTPSATLSLIPFAEWSLFGLGDRYEFATFSKTFDNLFEMKWEKTYEFGDTGPKNKAGAANTKNATPGTNETLKQTPEKADEKVKPNMGVPTQESARSGPEGAPQIAGSDQESGDKDGDQSTPSQIQDAAKKAETLSKGLKGLIRIVGILGSNPVSAVVDVISNWDEVKQAADDVISCISMVYEMIKPMLPDWWETLKGWLAKGLNVLADAAGMVLEGGKWLVSSAASAVSDGWGWVGSKTGLW